MKFSFLISTAAAAVFSFSQAQAQTGGGFNSKADRENYFTIQSVTVRELPNFQAADDAELTVQGNLTIIPFGPAVVPPAPGVGTNVPPNPPVIPSPAPSLGGPATGGILGPIIGVIADPTNVQSWVTLGTKAWDVIIANKPVANVSSNRVSVMPMSQADWAKMDGWRGPFAKNYQITATNYFGNVVVLHEYTISFSYGGQLQGQGQYIANATMIPTKVTVGWGYTLGSKVEVADVINVGTTTNPVPAVNMQLDWSIDTVLKHSQGAETYLLKGSGSVDRINPL